MAEEPRGKVWKPRIPADRRRSALDDLSYDIHKIGDVQAFRDMKAKAEKTIEDNRFE